jgi:hypothetical protein
MNRITTENPRLPAPCFPEPLRVPNPSFPLPKTGSKERSA